MKLFTNLSLASKAALRNLNLDAALDSFKNVLAVLGLGTVLADFATMHYAYILPCMCALLLVWFADYLRHDFGKHSQTLEGETLYTQVCKVAKVG